MARTNKKGEVFSHLTAFAIYRDKTGTFLSTTLGAAEAAGQTVLTLASATNADADDYHRVGAEEDVEIIQQSGAAAGSEITSKWAIGRAHASGEAVVEQTRTELGHIQDEGLRLTFEQDGEAIRSAIRRLEMGQLVGHIGVMFEIGLEGWNLENLATAFGMAESTITGSGTASAPHGLFFDASAFQAENNLSFEAVGVRKDGVIERLQLLGVEVDVGALQASFGRGRLAPITIRGRCTSGVRFLQNTA